ncbi:MAG TPA: toll/interleukin-1 receptor domain-containing protein, partial [Pyrinomonadaceae bacterium]|nr:toll/interleukin-1 receptor domain-containing protein [Pyrinomonadaceae bacterium]
MNTPTRPTVFISYSHKDEEWKNRFLPQLRALEQAGRITVWDDRKIDGGDRWYPEIKAAMEQAVIAVCLISSDFLASDFCVKEEVPFLLQRRERDGMIFIPMLLRPCPWNAFEWLKPIQMLPRDGKSVLVDYSGIEDAVFAEVADLVLKVVDRPAEYSLPIAPPSFWSTPEKIYIDRLPVTGAELFGRQKELQLLDDAWSTDKINVVSLVAWGGVGKSTLVSKWLERMQVDNYRGARRVYAWSFYSQGTGERVTSADLFINDALNWFGDSDPTVGSPWDKGERLARLVQKERTLLLLDGLEPLQSPYAHERGSIKDPALATVMLELAVDNPGLCLITTRQPMSDLVDFDATMHKDLEQISDEAGRALLRVGGAYGTDAEMENATRAFGNHALALNLL